MNTTQAAPARKPLNPLVKLALEVGPLAVFFLGFTFGERLLGLSAVSGPLSAITGAAALTGPGGPLFVATAAFMAAISASLAASWVLTRHLPRMAVVTAIVVAVFGGLTLVLRDETFIKMKPTIVNAIFALILGFGLIVQKRSYLKYLMGEMLPMDDEGWRRLTLRWAWFFVALGIVNEVVWRTQSTEFWVSFKTFGNLPLTFAFVLAQSPLIKRHMLEEDGEASGVASDRKAAGE
jgi:intracellular septation protein